MLLFLNGANSSKNNPNENYGREIMELYSLGADRGAYTETDIREAGARADRLARGLRRRIGWTNFRYDPASHDNRNKTIFGHTGNFDWRDVVDLCIGNPYHRSFFVLKMWSYFVPVPPDAATQASLEKLYVDSDWSIRAVVEAILAPSRRCTAARRWSSRRSSTAPACCARIGKGIDSTDLMYWSENAGQRLFNPPNVSGWNDNAWLDTSTLFNRWRLVYDAVDDRTSSEQRQLRPDRDRRRRRWARRSRSGATRRSRPRRSAILLGVASYRRSTPSRPATPPATSAPSGRTRCAT